MRGLELVQNEDWNGALAEFLASRELLPTRVAIKNAAMCLRQLKRRTDALAMYLELIDKFGSAMPADEKQTVEAAIAQLRDSTGEVSITTAIAGATVIVAGAERGRTPLAGPIRLDAGTHAVRIFKEGYLPFESQVTVAGRQTKVIAAELQALAQSGTLSVADAEGRHLLVVVDGAEVGTTPWTGTLAIGPHSVLLRGQGELGTAPAVARVIANQTTQLTLRAVRLDSGLRVEPVPSDAQVDVDGVTTGHGVWEGRLGSGLHRVEVSAQGFLAYRRDVTLTGRKEVLRVVLERDPSDPRWKEAFRSFPYLEAVVGGAIAPSFGGSADAACSRGECSERSIPLGYMLGVRGGYQLTRAMGLEVMLGYLRMTAGATRTVRADADFAVTSRDYRDTTALSAGMAGLSAAFRPIEQPLLLRASVGVLRARASFSNQATYSGQAQGPQGPVDVSFSLSIPESTESSWIPYVGPELHYGFRVASKLVIDVGVAVLFLFPPEAQRRGRTSRDQERGVRSQVANDVALPDGTTIRPGTTVLPHETGLGTFVCILPTLGGRWDL